MLLNLFYTSYNFSLIITFYRIRFIYLEKIFHLNIKKKIIKTFSETKIAKTLGFQSLI